MTRSLNPLMARSSRPSGKATSERAQPGHKSAAKSVTRSLGLGQPAKVGQNTQAGRRKRQFARTMRRFEAAVARLPKPAARPKAQVKEATPRQWLPRLSVSLVVGVLLLMLVVGAAVYIHVDERWYVYRENVQITGLTYLEAEAIYAASEIESWHILWLRPATIRQRLLMMPFVQDATVRIALPGQVSLHIVEAEPVALWQTNEGPLWIMPDGRARPVSDERFSELPNLIDPQRSAQDVTHPDELFLHPAVLQSAQALWQRLPDLEQLRFNAEIGLNFNLPGTQVWVYWGDGNNFATKLANLEAAQQLITTGEAFPSRIDLRFDRPYLN